MIIDLISTVQSRKGKVGKVVIIRVNRSTVKDGRKRDMETLQI
jgi:hypothetical protein